MTVLDEKSFLKEGDHDERDENQEDVPHEH
jgi:hypothetical protein